jgi:hypothetical protein
MFRQAGVLLKEKIEVTEEMLQAGLRVLDYARESYGENQLVTEVYIAMRQLESRQIPCDETASSQATLKR